MIKFKNVTKRYGKHVAVDNISFNINEGEFFVLIGPSGCGKTTTLKMINRLIHLSEGYIYFKDKPISDYPVYEMRWDIGYVLQQIALFPHMTIKENIAQVPQMKKWKEKDIDKRIDELLEMVGLEPEKYKNRKPDELSGGQRQRVGVIRALAADPPVILMDEPFSALDPISREKLQDDLIELQTKIKKTIIFVTPEGFKNNPQSEFVKQFMGSHLEDDAPCVEENAIIRDLGIMKPIDEVTSMSAYPIVYDNQQIEVLYQHLSESERVIVMQEDSVGQYVIDRKDIFKYLSQKKEVAQHD